LTYLITRACYALFFRLKLSIQPCLCLILEGKVRWPKVKFYAYLSYKNIMWWTGKKAWQTG